MDIARDLKLPPSQINIFEDHHRIKNISEVPTKLPMKRSFDVAFLMLPDNKIKNKEQDVQAMTELSVRSDLMSRYHQMNNVINNNKLSKTIDFSTSSKAYEDRCSSGSLNSSASSEKSDDMVESGEVLKSAFSKVSHIINVDSPVSPAISPDELSCSSASPPISYSPPSVNFGKNYNHFSTSAFQAIDPSGYSSQGNFKPLIYRGSSAPLINHHLSNRSCEQSRFQSFHFGASNLHSTSLMPQPEQFIRNPAAVILSTLLPTTLGALSLPAQNVCAKCNISFRMTSDLVYHMRSHHKNEHTQDSNRRKREEKLKCPVCSESFRERHHLTRHMTAHQDKEGDLLDHEIAEYHSRRK